MSLQSNPDPGRTLGQFGIAVLVLVLASAGLFWAIDLVSAEPEAVAQPTEAATVTPTPTVAVASPTPTPTPSPSPPTTTTPTPEPSTPSPTPTPEPSSEPSSEPTEDPTSDVDNSETSVQVLDGIKDGSDRAQDIADDLESDGYRVVAFGPSSIVYDTTTVFWTEGHEEEARRLAANNGWDEVVFNDILSETVDVHLVVGLDEQE